MATATTNSVVYSMEGTMCELCSCSVLCPCWVGADPDGGECTGTLGWHVERGTIEGIDVSGLSIVLIAHIPGNAFAGSWRVVVLLDDQAREDQRNAMLRAFTGELGGPLGDVAALVGSVEAVEVVPITFEVEGAQGRLRVEGILEAEAEPVVGPDGSGTTLVNAPMAAVFSKPAAIGRSVKDEVNLPQFDLVWSREGRNATQAGWVMEHTT